MSFEAEMNEKFGKYRWFMGAYSDGAKPQYWNAFSSYEDAVAAAKEWSVNDDARAVYGGTSWKDAVRVAVVVFETVRTAVVKEINKSH